MRQTRSLVLRMQLSSLLHTRMLAKLCGVALQEYSAQQQQLAAAVAALAHRKSTCKGLHYSIMLQYCSILHAHA
eukprot:14251-Heterococcus_DN1.PRE.2